MPGTAAAYTYDAVNLVVNTVILSGQDRGDVINALRKQQAFEGATGDIHFTSEGNRSGDTGICTLKKGRFIQTEDWIASKIELVEKKICPAPIIF